MTTATKTREPTRSPRSTSSQSAGRLEELERFARFCERTLTVEDRRPFRLEAFQRDILADFFGGARELVVLVPKKNGKSSLLAALALYHLLSVPFAEVVVVAASRDQASILMRQVTGFVRRSSALQDRLRVKQREITYERIAGRIRVLASDVDTVDGQLPTLALVDELHRHRSPELYGILRDGLGPRSGQLVAISTAGDNETSPLGMLRRQARAMPGLVHEGAHRSVSDEVFAYHEWALDPDADLDDLALVKTANPASWITEEELRRRRTASMRPWQWARFTCGVWSYGEDSAISDKDWRACADAKAQIPVGAQGVYIGVDLGWRHDLTAIVPVWWSEERTASVVRRPTLLKPPPQGTLPVAAVFDALSVLSERWPTATFVLDPLAGGEQLAQRIEADLPAATLLLHSQTHGPMCLAASRLAEAVASRRIVHPDSDELNAHVLAGTVRPVGELWRFGRPRGKPAPIDALIALAMAHSMLVQERSESPGEILVAWA